MKSFKIFNRVINQNSKPFIIAEAGINHNGSLDLAKKLVLVAKNAGADAIKFQTFKAKEFCGDPNQIFTYKSQNKLVSENMLDMFSRFELKKDEWIKIKKFAENKKINFFSSPQNSSDLDFLIEIGVKCIKVGSDDLTNLEMLKYFSTKKLPLILSSGMSTLTEINDGLLSSGWFEGNNVAMLSCTSEYPTPIENLNILKIKTIKNSFPGLTVGFSDHSIGNLAAVLAIAKGAKIFEKHFTLSNDLPGPDHWFSENPISLKKWINDIHQAHKALGNGLILPTKKEKFNSQEWRRVIVCRTTIKKGDVIKRRNLVLMRVSGKKGLSSKFINEIINKKSWRSFKKNEIISF